MFEGPCLCGATGSAVWQYGILDKDKHLHPRFHQKTPYKDGVCDNSLIHLYEPSKHYCYDMYFYYSTLLYIREILFNKN